MQLRPEQLQAHLARGLNKLYTVHGDEPLRMQEAADAIRAAARAAGYSERQVFTVSGAHYDWSSVLGAAQAMSLFAERQLIDIRIPSGKPGKDGAAALQRYTDKLPDDVLTLVQLPQLDYQQSKAAWFKTLESAGVSVRVEMLERSAIPAWLAQRLSQQAQHVQAGEAGQHTLAFFADCVEGNLLAAHQEIQKLGLLYPAGELSLEQVQASVLNVARYDLSKLVEALWTVQPARSLRMLAGLRAEGEAVVRVHWMLAEDVRALARVRGLMDTGTPLAMALRNGRVWGPRERWFERILPRLSGEQCARWLQSAQSCDGIVKGLKQPDWPDEPWDALQQWLWQMLQDMRPAQRRSARPTATAQTQRR
jgi:DNA polymerase-3 subunit delta